MTTATESIGLAATWRLLSLGFTPPAAETLAEVQALAEALHEAEPTLELDAVLASVRKADEVRVGTQFAALFRGKVLVAPYEGSYELDPIRQGRQMADVAGFYQAFGVGAHGPAGERPDHVGCELEFLAFLELRRLEAAEADEPGADVLDDICTSFLEDHAGAWLPTFFAEVRNAAPDASLYAALAELGERVLTNELERRGISPTPRKRHRRGAVERDSFECGGAAPANGIRPR